MALLPDPTTAASERSPVKNRLTGSRRRGSGIKNRHRSRTVSKTSLRGARRMRVQGFQGQGCAQHESTQPGPLTLLPHKTRVRHKKRHRSKTNEIRQTSRSCMSSLLRSIQDCVQEVPVGQMAQGTPPSAHAAAFPGGFNRLHQLLHGFFTKF